MKITLIDLKNKLEQDFGWENLMADNDNKWFVENLLKDTIQAIEVMRCCKTDSELLAFKEKQKNLIIEMTEKDEELGLYED